MKVLYLALGDIVGVANDLKTIDNENTILKYLKSSEEFFKKFFNSGGVYPDIDLASYKKEINDLIEKNKGISTGLGFMALMMLYKISEIEETQGELEKITEKDKVAACCRLLYHAVKEVRQMCWLSIAEDYYCEKIENAYKEHNPGKEEWLIIAVLPEFMLFPTIGNFDNVAVSVSVAHRFFHGGLPDRLTDNRKMRRFVNLSRDSQNSQHKIVIFAGSLRVREQNTEEDTGIISNIVPVFYDGRLCHIWEKQMISDEDGIKKEERHTVLYDDTQGSRSQEAYAGQYYAGAATRSLLQQFNLNNFSPVFALTINGKEITFAVTVCLDYKSADIIHGQTTDIHLLIADGMPVSGHLDHIVALKLFLYCDLIYGGRVGAFENISQKPDYWKGLAPDKVEKDVDTFSRNVKDRIFCYISNITIA